MLLTSIQQAQSPDFWDRILNQGVPLFLLVAIAIFVARYVWPFITKRIEANDEWHRTETAKFLEALDKITKEHAAMSAARDKTQAAQTEAIVRLTQSIEAFTRVRTSTERERGR